MVYWKKSWSEGNKAEDLFIELRGDKFLRKANTAENIHEHWDVLDAEFGRVDVKAPKRKNRAGPLDYTIWWELKNVRGRVGWGSPNGIERYIALQCETAFHLINPDHIIDEINQRCTGEGKGEWMLYSRPGRQDLMTILPLTFIKDNTSHTVELG